MLPYDVSDAMTNAMAKVHCLAHVIPDFREIAQNPVDEPR